MVRAMELPTNAISFTRDALASRAALDVVTARIARMCNLFGVDVGAAAALLERMMAPWGRLPLGRAARWPSEVGDDHTPCEVSLAVGATPQLRVMVEPLGNQPSLLENQKAALSLLQTLAGDRELDVDLRRLDTVRDLFMPAAPRGRFAMWVAASLAANGRSPAFKVYLDPQAHGSEHAWGVVEECLVRLGFEAAWDGIARSLLARGPVADRPFYVSLDLSARSDARLKIYARHQRVTLQELARAAAPARATLAGETMRFLETVVPERPLLDGRAPFTCWSFTAGSNRPESATTHVPINGYAQDDGVVVARVARALEELGLESSLYVRAIAQFANRTLEDGIGLHSYVSFCRDDAGPRVTVYLPLELYAPGVVAPTTVVPDPPDAEAIVQRFEELEPITIHPMLRRLAREPLNGEHLWAILANFQISISRNFARHLAQITARVEDDRVRSILAHQLDDELGNGDPTRAHVGLFAAMMERLSAWKPASVGERLLQPGRMFEQNLRAVYDASDAWEAVGAVMVGEVFGKQIDLFLGQQFRRQREIDTEQLTWLTLHEQLEVEHAEDSSELAALVPNSALPALWRGAQRAGWAGRTFLDDLYLACYGR